MDRTPAVGKVVIHIDRDAKHTSGAGKRTARPVASAVQVNQALLDHKRALEAQADLRQQGQMNRTSLARIAADFAAADDDEPDRQLRERAARRYAAGCFCSTAAVLLVGLPPAFLYRNEPAQFALVTFGAVGALTTLIKCSGHHDPRESLEERHWRLVARGTLIHEELLQATEALSRSEAALTQIMKPFMVHRLTEHTPLPKDTAVIVADYVGANEDLPQAHG